MSKATQKFAIFGAGLSGLAAYRFALRLGFDVIIHDDNEANLATIDDAYIQQWQDWNWAEIDALILSPGIPHNFPAPHPVASKAIAENKEIISEIEFGLRYGNFGRLAIITGTNGKSTTTALSGHLLEQAGLKVAIGGNLGTALCDLPQSSDDITILELSSYQLELTPSLQPEIAALLNITPDHLDRHGGLQGYIHAKQKALSALPETGLGLIGNEGSLMADIISWSQSLPCQIQVIEAGTDSIDNPYLAGAHNAQNAAFASAIARYFGLSDAQITQGLQSFIGLPHRLCPVGSYQDVTFVNDSKATNGDATARALSAYDNIIWIAGGRAKEDGLRLCQPYFDAVKAAHFFGESAALFSEQAQADIHCSIYDTLDDAFAGAVLNLEKDDIVLLSPAAASFDQFANFGARGRHFEALVTNFINHKEAAHAR